MFMVAEMRKEKLKAGARMALLVPIQGPVCSAVS